MSTSEQALGDLADWIVDLARESGVESIADVVARVNDPSLTAAFEAWRAAERAGAPAAEQRSAARDFAAAMQKPRPNGAASPLQTLLAARLKK